MRRLYDRHTDAKLLDMLHRRAMGQTMREIAEAHGMSRNAVIGAVNRILRDSKESGFDPLGSDA